MFLKRFSFSVSLLILSIIAIAQTTMNKYEKAWQKIDTLIGKDKLTASAIVEVEKVYAMAKAEKEDAYLIKALVYRMMLSDMKEEESPVKNIQRIEKEIISSAEPARSLLNSLLASMYWSYFQQQRYKLYDRTETTGFKKTDISTWSVDDFHKKISELFLASLKNEKLLQQTKLDRYDPIISRGNVRYLRPTLFDLLAQRAIEYFRNDEVMITKPAYAFQLNQASVFDPAADFVTRKFPNKDSLSLHYKALLLYQRVIAFHLNDKKPDALIDADLGRLEFVYNNAEMENKGDLYTMALNHIAQQYGNQPAASAAWSRLAARYLIKADGDTTVSYQPVIDICKKVIAINDSTEGAVECRQLLNTITRKEITFRAERVNIPDIPFRMLVRYRNVPQIYIRIVPVSIKDKDELSKWGWWQAEHWKYLANIAPLKTYTQTLPADTDFREHMVEMKIDALPSGNYILLASASSEFEVSKSLLSAQPFMVSGIAYINQNNNFFVVDRESGAPIQRANVQVWYRVYDASKNKYSQRQGENLVTDKNGFFSVSESRTNTDNSFRLEIKNGNDKLFIDEYRYNSYSSGEAPPENEQQTFLFTDRAIYRPGQTIWFKGIFTERNTKSKQAKIVASKKTRLFLIDTNGEKIDSLEVVTNEFGSYSGKFVLPGGKLNGQFDIQDTTTGSSVSFSVEEYKRPKFSATIEKPAGTYKVNDTITVKGTASAFAGNNIDGAKVTYRVVRNVRFRIWDYYSPGRKIWPPQIREQLEIVNGITQTNEKGEFTIRFKAIPNTAFNKKDQPVFNYEVTADVTDINGETHSATNSISVGYHAMELSIGISDETPVDSLKNLTIRTENLNSIFEKASVTVSITKLKQPTRVFRNRLWEAPDRFLFSQQEYYKLFPYDVYNEEDNPKSWAKLEKVVEVTDTTSENSSFRIPVSGIKSGWYVIEASARDKWGEPIKASKEIFLTGDINAQPKAFASIEISKSVGNPGETISYKLTTNQDSVWMVHHRSKANDTSEEQFISLNKNSQSLNLPLSEADQGGVGLDISFVKHNRFYSENVSIYVPFAKKQLTVSYETFRDKVIPGSKEKWKIKISGYKADKVIAEMLTTMYDASLDQFTPQVWSTPEFWDNSTSPQIWTGDEGFNLAASHQRSIDEGAPPIDFNKSYDELFANINNMGVGLLNASPLTRRNYMRGDTDVMLSKTSNFNVAEAQIVGYNKAAQFSPNGEDVMADWNNIPPRPATPATSDAAIQIRKNFNETAFFLPDLKTDSAGNIEFSFTMPEALTKWKWMTFAHTKDLSIAYSEKTIVTQKELMVQPNAPRFLREGDRMDFTTKIVNLTDKELTGQVELQLIDPTTNQPVDGWFRNFFPNQYFTAPEGQSVATSFTIEIPFQYNKPVNYRLIARSGNISDGEEMMLPVISNRLLVTESVPIQMKGSGTKQFKIEKLIKSAESETLNHQALTIEFTSNPAWYAIQALPYLMEYPYDCAEQTFNRFYANALAKTIVNSTPKIKAVFEKWKTTDTAALQSNLEKNPELKSLLLEETPWVLQAKSESQQKRNIALLFDMVRMSREANANLESISNIQLSNGAFPWFKGGADDRYMTQYILTAIGHLKKLNALPADNEALQKIITTGISYLDKKIKEDYDRLVKANVNLNAQQLSYLHIQYLYMRSFFTETTIPGDLLKAYSYYRKQAQQFWVKESKYMQGMIALSLFRTGDVQTANNILKSLDQNSIKSAEMGMYWKEFNTGGYYWHQSPIEAHSLLTEAFSEISKNNKSIDDLKTWLLKQKQTQHWRTTKATADACYVLLMNGTNWIAGEPKASIKLGGITLNSSTTDEAGTGYFKKIIEGTKVTPEMGNISVTLNTQNNQSAWGAAYWQYFEELDKITPSSTPLKLVKKLFVEKNSDRGPVLQPLKEGDVLHVGDKVKVRVEIRVDRTLEYVHMKDMRAATLEPVNVMSGYKWKGGLGYYESTKDASTNFFFSYLPKGTWVFEYGLFVTHTGTFSNGVTTIQCMYAPEFTSHSEGVKVTVE